MMNHDSSTLASFPEGEHTGFISGIAGRIEVSTMAPRMFEGKSASESPVLVIVCHPHSLMGGTKDNKVVHTLAKMFRDKGMYTIRFNFRGVGNSEGVFDAGRGESDDVMTVLEWAQSVLPVNKMPVWLAGFSFGAYVSLHTANRLNEKGVDLVSQLVTIAPPVGHFPIENEKRPSCPWIVVQGDQDEVIEPTRVFDWIKTLVPPPQLIVMEGASHFFHGRLIELRNRLESVLFNLS
jgi:alpha/beta superfamily hydrolase